MVPHHAYGLINEVFRQVIVGARIKMDCVIVYIQLWVVLVGQCTVKAVPSIEPLAQRPIAERPCCTVLFGARQMPFANGHSVVALPPQDLGQGAGRVVDAPVVAGHAIRPLRNYSNAY